MKTNKLTLAERKYISLIGEEKCKEAYMEFINGNGANTVAEKFLSKFIAPKFYTKGGDCIINAGRKITKH